MYHLFSVPDQGLMCLCTICSLCSCDQDLPGHSAGAGAPAQQERRALGPDAQQRLAAGRVTRRLTD